ncbi:MAG: DUF4390 domain-containing protein [Gammaproteobacteria bacterium]
MDFIMPEWKKSERILLRNVLFCLVTALLPLQPLPCTAETPGINIRDVNGRVIDGTYVINADIEYHFSAETEKALKHGVPLQFNTTVTVKKQRRWLWDKTMSTIVLKYRLQYHPLSGYYLMTTMNDDEYRQFKTLSDVMEFLGKMKNQPLLSRDVLVAEAGKFYGRIRVRLDIQSLPVPLRPLAYISRQWRLASPVYSWSIQL